MFYVANAQTPVKGVSGQTQAGPRGVSGQTQASTRVIPQQGARRVTPGRPGTRR